MTIKSFIDSDELGRDGYCFRVHFDADISYDGSAEIACWGDDGEDIHFSALPAVDQQKINDIVNKHYEEQDGWNAYGEYLHQLALEDERAGE